VIFQDNAAAIALADKGMSTSERTRHINIRYFWLKDRIDSGELALEHIPTKYMVADILMKPLFGVPFSIFKDILNGSA